MIVLAPLIISKNLTEYVYPKCIMISILILAVSVAAVFLHGTLVEVAKVLYAIYSVLQDINGKLPDREELRKGSF